MLKTAGGSIEIELLSVTNTDPVKQISHAAHTCYQANKPGIEDKAINIQNRLFETGHHTTLQHWYMTFSINGIAVGDVTFGLHLASPFYNSDQRSGRFCSAMFDNPDYSCLARYIREFWPEVKDDTEMVIMDYIKKSIGSYNCHLGNATLLAQEFLKEERPLLSEESVIITSGKIAQEQMRMFIPVIFPTGLDYTINLSALVALWTSAWNPTLRAVTDAMRDLFLERYPAFSYMFNEERRCRSDWYPGVRECLLPGCVKEKPEYQLKNIIIGMNKAVMPVSAKMHPVDLLHFSPEMLNNSYSCINAQVEVSLATMGQDQRHRTVFRTEPVFTGHAYLPPILAELKLGEKMLEVMHDWESLKKVLPMTLSAVLAPYGSMVSYVKSANLNAIMHEMAKRTCWCAQEEIYHLSVEMRKQVVEQYPELEKIFCTPCMRSGKCAEGVRYCGRNIKSLGFPQRRV